MRSGCVSFVLYVAYLAVIVAYCSSLKDQAAAYSVEQQLASVFDSSAFSTGRTDVRDVASLWAYTSALHAALWNGGPNSSTAADDRGARPCGWLADVSTSPCGNTVCDGYDASLASGARDARACDAVVDAHCAELCASVAAARLRRRACPFDEHSPLSPCANPVCDGVLANATAAAAGDGPAADGAAAVCADLVRLFCAASGVGTRGCLVNARRELGDTDAAPRRRAQQRASLSLVPRAGMIDNSNRAIGSLMLWHARWAAVTCEGAASLASGLRDCGASAGSMAAEEISMEPFEGLRSGREYTPGIYTRGNTTLRLGLATRSLLGRQSRVAGRPVEELHFAPLNTGHFVQDANEDGPSLAAAQANIAELREDGWLDESVLSASLVLVVFNARLMRYATATATFVFSKGGSVPKSLHTTSIPAQLGVFNEHVRLSALAIALLAIDTILVLRRVLGVWFRCQESVGRIYEQDKQQVMAQYSQGFAPSRARMRLQRARTQRRNLQHFGLLAQHAGVKRLREAEEQANHWAWLCVELVEVCSQWAYTTLVLLVSAQTARVNAAFDSAVDGDDASAPLALSDRDGMDAVLRLVYTLIDAGTLTSYLTYVASLTVILLLIRLFRYSLFHRRLSTTWYTLG